MPPLTPSHPSSSNSSPVNPGDDEDILVKMDRKIKKWQEEQNKGNENLSDSEKLLDQVFSQTSGIYKKSVEAVLGRMEQDEGVSQSLQVPVLRSVMIQTTSDILDGKIQNIDDIPDDVREFISKLLEDIRAKRVSTLPSSPFWKVYDTLMQRLPYILQERLRWMVRATILIRIYEFHIRKREESPLNIQDCQEQIGILADRIKKVETGFWKKPLIQRVDEKESFGRKMEYFKDLVEQSEGIFPDNKKRLLEMLEKLPIFYKGFYDSFYSGKSEKDFLYRVDELSESDIHNITFHFIDELFIQTRGDTKLVRSLLEKIHKRGKDQKIFFLNFEPQLPDGVYTSGQVLIGCMIVSPYNSGNPDSKSLYIGSANILEDYRKISSPIDTLLEESLGYAFIQEKAEELYCHVNPGSPQERLWKSRGFEVVKQEKDELMGGGAYITLMKLTRETYERKALEKNYEKLGIME